MSNGGERGSARVLAGESNGGERGRKKTPTGGVHLSVRDRILDIQKNLDIGFYT